MIEIVEGYEVGCVVKCTAGRNEGRVGRITEMHHDWYNKGNDFCMKTTIDRDYVSPLVYKTASESDLVGEDYRVMFDVLVR